MYIMFEIIEKTIFHKFDLKATNKNGSVGFFSMYIYINITCSQVRMGSHSIYRKKSKKRCNLYQTDVNTQIMKNF